MQVWISNANKLSLRRHKGILLTNRPDWLRHRWTRSSYKRAWARIPARLLATRASFVHNK